MKLSFQDIASKYKKEVNSDIRRFFIEKRKNLYLSPLLNRYLTTIERFVMNGGKRLRPIALIAAYRGFGGTEDISRASLSVEFFHNCTLIEDDIMDEDELRRNKPTTYKILKEEFLKRNKERKYKGSLFNRESSKSSVSNSILLGNILYSMGNNCIADSKFSSIIKSDAQKLYNEAFIIVNDGQLLDLKLEKNNRASEQNYIEMAERKTANLIKACVELGAIFAGVSKERQKAIGKYALNSALGFQIADDLMDINPDSQKGHSLGSDLVKGKKTLVVIKALEMGCHIEKNKILRVLGRQKASKRNIKKAIDALHTSGAVNYTQEFAKKKIKQSKVWLKKARLTQEYEDFFSDLADYFIERNI
ncbi:polyprenyl synthetase family protein [Bacteroidota bacterium]